MMAPGSEAGAGSLFDDVLAFGYYDGPTDGFAISRDGQVFAFRMVQEDWDAEMRVFALSRVATKEHSGLAARLRELRALWRAQAVVPLEMLERDEQAIVEAAGEVVLMGVIAARSITGEIAAWCPVRAPLPERDWLSVLDFGGEGLERGER